MLFFILSFIFILMALVFYARSPAYSSKDWPQNGIKTYPMSEDYVRQAGAIRVMTYNIGYAFGVVNNQGSILSREEVEKNLDQIIENIKALSLDVVALQEVDFGAHRTHFINQMDEIAKKAGYPYAAYATTWNQKYIAWPYWPFKKHFGKMLSGQVILSRFPILSQQVVTFEKPKNNPFWYNWFYLNRVAQKVELGWEGEKLVFWNVHLEAFDEQTREEQLKKLSNLVLLNENKKVIVAGDFNTDNPIIENFKSTEAFFTYPSWSPNEKLDHIFYSSFFNLNKSDKSSGVEASDHLAVWAIFYK